MSEEIPKGTYRVRRESAWLCRKGFGYELRQKFRILEGPYKGRQVLLCQELDDSETLEIREDAPPI